MDETLKTIQISIKQDVFEYLKEMVDKHPPEHNPNNASTVAELAAFAVEDYARRLMMYDKSLNEDSKYIPRRRR